MRRFPILICGLVLFVSSSPSMARAQTSKVVPSWAAALEGNSSMTYPLSYTACRFQYLVEARAVMTKSAVLQGFAFRLDDGSSLAAGTQKTLQPKVVFYLVSTKAANVSTSWAANIGSAQGTTVFSGKLSLPAASRSFPAPNPFTAVVPLVKPFVWTAGAGNLLIDWTEGQTYQFVRWSEDGVSYPKSAGSLVTRIWEDKTCSNSRGDQAYILLSRTSNLIGGTIDVRFYLKPASTGNLDLFLGWLGASHRSFGGIPLPLSLAALGLGTCKLATDIQLTGVATTAPLRWSVPNLPALAGKTLFTQGMALDSKSGAFVTTYNAFQLTFVPNPPPAQPYQSVFRSRYAGQTTGYMSPSFYYGPVVQFRGLFR